MEVNDNNTTKEDDTMASLSKPMQATIVKKEELKSFINELKKNRVSSDYWDECRNSKNSISKAELERMKKMCNGE